MFETTILSVYKANPNTWDRRRVVDLPIDFRVAENNRQKKDHLNDLFQKYPADYAIHEMTCSSSGGIYSIAQYKQNGLVDRLIPRKKTKTEEPAREIDWVAFYIYDPSQVKKGIPKRLPHRCEVCTPTEAGCMAFSIRESQRVRGTKQAILMFSQKGKPEWLE